MSGPVPAQPSTACARCLWIIEREGATWVDGASYCSWQCARAEQARLAGQLTHCERCGEPFTPHDWHEGGSPKRFCSARCQVAASNARRKRPDGPGPRTGRELTQAERAGVIMAAFTQAAGTPPPDLPGAACASHALPPDAWSASLRTPEGRAARCVCLGECPHLDACRLGDRARQQRGDRRRQGDGSGASNRSVNRAALPRTVRGGCDVSEQVTGL
jgi:hypothetical protein